MEKQKPRELKDIIVPLIAAEMLEKEGGEEKNEKSVMKELIVRLLSRELEAFEKDEAKRRRIALNAIEATKERIAATQAEKNRCNHRKPDGKPRTGGQKLDNGQLLVICLHCQQEWYHPPNKELGQVACPRELWPDPDSIGG